MASGKSSWPELVGKHGEEAVKTIEKENEDVKAIIVVKGTDVTGDFDCGRVRVWVNESGIVYLVPTIG